MKEHKLHGVMQVLLSNIN